MELNTSYWGNGSNRYNIPDDWKVASIGSANASIKSLYTADILKKNEHIDSSIFWCYSMGSKLADYKFVKVYCTTQNEWKIDVSSPSAIPFANYFMGTLESNNSVSPISKSTERVGYDLEHDIVNYPFNNIYPITRYAREYIRWCCYVIYATVSTVTYDGHNYPTFSSATRVSLKTFLEDSALQTRYENEDITVIGFDWVAYAKRNDSVIQNTEYDYIKMYCAVDTDNVPELRNPEVAGLAFTGKLYMSGADYFVKVPAINDTIAISYDKYSFDYVYLITNASDNWEIILACMYGDRFMPRKILRKANLMKAFHEFAYTGMYYTSNPTTAASLSKCYDDLYLGVEAFGRTAGKYIQFSASDDEETNNGRARQANPNLVDDTDPELDPNPDYQGEDDPNNPNIDPNDYVLDTPLTPPAITTIDVFNRSFAMNITQIQALADWLWNADDDKMTEIIEGLKLMGENPMNALIDCRLYPFAITDMIHTTGGQLIKLGRVTSDVYGIKLGNSSNCIIDLGECTFFEKNKNFLDYSPHTQARLYLPYCGWHSIDPAEFMGKRITGKLIVDVVTGTCNCIIYADGIILINATGTIGVEIPMTGTDSAAFASQTINASMQCISNIVQAGGAVIGGMGNISKGTDLTRRATNISNLSRDRAGDYRLGSSMQSEGAQQFSTGLGAGADAVYAGWKAHSIPVQYEMAGAASPACANWLPQYAYFVIDRPVPLIPDNYGHTIGFACCESGQLSGYSGFTVCSNVDTSGFAQATESERAELKALLEAGVYL